MRATPRILVPTITLLLVLPTVLLAGETQKDLKETIQALNDKANKAMVEGDLETMLAYHTDDVIVMPNNHKMLQGKEALKANMEEMGETGTTFRSFNNTIIDIWSCGDDVYEMGTYALSVSIPGLERPVADVGKYFTIWEKQSDGTYKTRFSIWNTDVKQGN